jgi:hypothetical protein
MYYLLLVVFLSPLLYLGAVVGVCTSECTSLSVGSCTVCIFVRPSVFSLRLRARFFYDTELFNETLWCLQVSARLYVQYVTKLSSTNIT